MPGAFQVAFASHVAAFAPHRLAFFTLLALSSAQAKTLSLPVQPPPLNEVSAPAPAAPSAKLGKQLWLFGGGEPICSSVEPDLCDPAKRQAAEAFFTQQLALRGKLLRCDDDSVRALQALPGWPDAAGFSAQGTSDAAKAAASRSLQRRETVLDALQSLNRLPRTSPELSDALKPLLGEPLNDDELSLIEDACEVRLADKQGRSLTMQVYWDGMPAFSRQLFERFIREVAERKALRQATQRNAAQNGASAAKPTLLLLTSSSYNPFEWVDYYQQVFEAAGAEVIWLPLEPAMARGSCKDLTQNRLRFNGQLRRAERYPELAAYQLQLCQNPAQLLALVEQADAVFINGGDQSLTMRTLTDAQGMWTPVAARLLARVEHEGIPLAGSSAGTAIQGGRAKNRDGRGGLVMVSNGQSSHALRFGAQALDIDAPNCRASRSCNYQSVSPSQDSPAYLADAALTYHPELGLRLFDLAVTDTHFRQRNREGRMLRLLHDSNSAAGVGVDEATLLRADFAPRSKATAATTATLLVYGQGSVWWLDASQAQGELPAQPRLGPARAVQGSWQGLHVARLSPGDTLQVQRDAAGAYHYQGTLGCTASNMAAGKVDAHAYNTWQDSSLSLTFFLNADRPMAACTDAQGRWHYLPTPLAVTLQLGAVDASR